MCIYSTQSLCDHHIPLLSHPLWIWGDYTVVYCHLTFHARMVGQRSCFLPGLRASWRGRSAVPSLWVRGRIHCKWRKSGGKPGKTAGMEGNRVNAGQTPHKKGGNWLVSRYQIQRQACSSKLNKSLHFQVWHRLSESVLDGGCRLVMVCQSMLWSIYLLQTDGKWSRGDGCHT